MARAARKTGMALLWHIAGLAWKNGDRRWSEPAPLSRQAEAISVPGWGMRPLPIHDEEEPRSAQRLAQLGSRHVRVVERAVAAGEQGLQEGHGCRIGLERALEFVSRLEQFRRGGGGAPVQQHGMAVTHRVPSASPGGNLAQ